MGRKMGINPTSKNNPVNAPCYTISDAGMFLYVGEHVLVEGVEAFDP